MSTEPIYRATIDCVTRRFTGRKEALEHLDIGAGSGDLIRLMKEHFDTTSACCDYTDELMALPDQKVDVIDLNRAERLPYDDDRFDVVTATEVIEHLEDFRKLLREARMVLKPRGLLVVSTPNILNINSRLRNLWFGFAELMGPLPVHERTKESCAGHISPVSPFYIMHGLYEMAFRDVTLNVDRTPALGYGQTGFSLDSPATHGHENMAA